jgi:hypothetical protein
VSGSPDECGHVIHYECARHLKPNESGNFSCPLCRADLGRTLLYWYDLTGNRPRY